MNYSLISLPILASVIIKGMKNLIATLDAAVLKQTVPTVCQG